MIRATLQLIMVDYFQLDLLIKSVPKVKLWKHENIRIIQDMLCQLPELSGDASCFPDYPIALNSPRSKLESGRSMEFTLR